MEYLYDAIFKMAANEMSEITFSSYNSAFRRDRDKIFVFKPMFKWERNPMISLKIFSD